MKILDNFFLSLVYLDWSHVSGLQTERKDIKTFKLDN